RAWQDGHGLRDRGATATRHALGQARSSKSMATAIWATHPRLCEGGRSMSEFYKLEAPGCGVTFEADRLRRDHHELVGELTVRCTLPGVQAVNGCLSVGDFNFPSVRARQDRAKLLKSELEQTGTLIGSDCLRNSVRRFLSPSGRGSRQFIYVTPN